VKYSFKLLVAGLVLLGLHLRLHAQVTFTLASAPVVGSSPISVTAADINGDGKVDLICANYGSNTLSVLTNNGSGGFVNAGTYTVGTNPVSVAAADVNGDGRMDLICANYGSNTLSVLTNNRSSHFVTAGTYAVGVHPWSVTTADVNGDGKPDLISANFGANTLSILVNTSTFPPPKLAISHSAGSVIVSWPSSLWGWALQQNTNPATTNWSASSGVTNNGTNKNLSLASPMGDLFFRLSLTR
jgi:hypothetical protein